MGDKKKAKAPKAAQSSDKEPKMVTAPGTEIAFFDVETTIPSAKGEGHALLEFGCVVVCPRRLIEVGSFSTLIRPSDLASVSAASVRCNGITRDAVAAAPFFRDVADAVYTVLNGRIWAGHNIVRFDSARIREAFAEIGRPPPEPKGMIDTLPLLTQRFGRRAGNMKMASLASYFGLGHQRHRSIDDVRMNFEVLKYCATVLFLEASLPDIFSVAELDPERAVTRSQGKESSSPDALMVQQIPLHANETIVPETCDQVLLDEAPTALASHIEEMKIDGVQTDVGTSGFAGFLEPDEVSTNNISISVIPLNYYGRRTIIKYQDCPLQLCSLGLRVHFGVSTKYVDYAGRPKLSIVLDIPDNLCEVLEFCDQLAQKSAQESGSTSEWRTVVKRNGFVNRANIRLQIPSAANGEGGAYSTEISRKELSGNIQKLVFSRSDTADLDSLFIPGANVDAFFSVEVYDYQQNAGIRLVAKRLIIHSK